MCRVGNFLGAGQAKGAKRAAVAAIMAGPVQVSQLNDAHPAPFPKPDRSVSHIAIKTYLQLIVS